MNISYKHFYHTSQNQCKTISKEIILKINTTYLHTYMHRDNIDIPQSFIATPLCTCICQTAISVCLTYSLTPAASLLPCVQAKLWESV